MANRQEVLEILQQAQGHDAETVVQILASDKVKYLTMDDLNEIKVNYLQRTINDKFSQDLRRLNAFIVHDVAVLSKQSETAKAKIKGLVEMKPVETKVTDKKRPIVSLQHNEESTAEMKERYAHKHAMMINDSFEHESRIRQDIRKRLAKAQGRDAQTVVDILSSWDEVRYLTVGDLHYIKVNYIEWEANDKFSQDIEKLGAYDIYKKILIKLQ